MFDTARQVKLDDGRMLTLIYQGETYQWGAYIPGPNPSPSSAPTPAEAISGYLGYAPAETPGWLRELSERLARELRDAQRYVCDCCRYRTLLNVDEYEICAVCGWEDDGRARTDPNTPSGPNHVSLAEGRANFARFGTAKERSRGRVRMPRPEEHPAA